MSTLPSNTLNIQDILRRYEEQSTAANAANETRYQGILSTLQGQGEASKTDIRRGGIEERGQIAQGLTGRGLFNTTVLDSLGTASREREGRESTRIDESVADRMAGVMERRTDQGPDMGLMANLLQMYGQGMGQQAGQGGSGVGRDFNFAGVNTGGGGGFAAGYRGSQGGSGGDGSGGGGGGGGSRVGTVRNPKPYTNPNDHWNYAFRQSGRSNVNESRRTQQPMPWPFSDPRFGNIFKYNF